MSAKKKAGKKTSNASRKTCCGSSVASPSSGPAMCMNPEDCAQAMKALADPNRIRIIRALIAGPRNVSQIAEDTGLGPHRVSHHLSRMRLARLVECVRDGQKIVYSVSRRIACDSGLDFGCSRILFRPLR
jgi:DNA-binding transcriptional ArsR family regulator